MVFHPRYPESSVADPDPDPPDPQVFGPPGSRSGSRSGSTSQKEVRIRILLSSCKNNKKNLDSYYFVTLFDVISLKNDVNVPSKSNQQKNLFEKIVFCWRLEGH